MCVTRVTRGLEIVRGRVATLLYPWGWTPGRWLYHRSLQWIWTPDGTEPDAIIRNNHIEDHAHGGMLMIGSGNRIYNEYHTRCPMGSVWAAGATGSEVMHNTITGYQLSHQYPQLWWRARHQDRTFGM